MTAEERDNAIRCLKKWIEQAPYLQTYKTCLEALEAVGNTDRSRLQKFLDDDPSLAREVTAEELEAENPTSSNKDSNEDDWLEVWLKECREATLEERQSVDKYVESISTPTGVTFEVRGSG